MLISSTVEQICALRGHCLGWHFDTMDKFLWKSLSIISCLDREYMSLAALGPVVKEISGVASGRKWFIKNENLKLINVLVDQIRNLSTHKRGSQFILNLQPLLIFRDSLREWVEGYIASTSVNEKLSKRYMPVETERLELQIKHFLKHYYKLRDEITEAYLPLVISVASKYGFSEDSKLDLIQVGTTGLIHAVERFNNTDPNSFSLFAKKWIKQRILMDISRKGPMIKIAHSVLEASSRMKREGLKGNYEKSEKLRGQLAVKDVILTDQIEATIEQQQELLEMEKVIPTNLNLEGLPKSLRRILLLKYDLIDHAICPYSKEELGIERVRQQRMFNKKEL